MSQADCQSIAQAAWELCGKLESALGKLDSGLIAAQALTDPLVMGTQDVSPQELVGLSWTLERLDEHQKELAALHDRLFKLLHPAVHGEKPGRPSSV